MHKLELPLATTAHLLTNSRQMTQFVSDELSPFTDILSQSLKQLTDKKQSTSPREDDDNSEAYYLLSAAAPALLARKNASPAGNSTRDKRRQHQKDK